jgi:hypothetical protein
LQPLEDVADNLPWMLMLMMMMMIIEDVVRARAPAQPAGGGGGGGVGPGMSGLAGAPSGTRLAGSKGKVFSIDSCQHMSSVEESIGGPVDRGGQKKQRDQKQKKKRDDPCNGGSSQQQYTEKRV